MSKKNEIELVPCLRFSEFRNNGVWKGKPLGEVLIKNSTKNKNQKYSLVESVSNKFGFIKQNEYFDNRIIASKDTSNYYVINKGHFAYNPSRIDVGSLAYKSDDNTSIISPLYVSFKANNSVIDDIFLLNYFKSNEFTKQMIFEGGVRNTLNYDNLSQIKVPITQLDEQRKIAACLSSLDEVITGESQKLEVLKEHKKGLLQNLFPQSRLNRDLSDEMMSMMGTKKNQGNQENQKNQGSDNVPKVRSKEFEDSGEWMETTLGEIGEPLMCKRIFKEETTPNPNNGVPFYKIGTFGRSADAYISKEIYEEYKSKYSFPRIGDILISASGTIGRLVIYDGSPAYFQDSNIIWLGHYEDAVLNRFLLYCYSNLTWQTSDGGVISRLYNSDFKRMKIKYPDNKEEQQKIASCLSSIDELIIAQTQKIEALQLHKKGLLQGLFPNLNEVTE